MADNNGEVKEVKEEVEQTQESSSVKSPAWVKTAIWVLIGVIAGILIGFCVFSSSLSNAAKTVGDSSEVAAEQLVGQAE